MGCCDCCEKFCNFYNEKEQEVSNSKEEEKFSNEPGEINVINQPQGNDIKIDKKKKNNQMYTINEENNEDESKSDIEDNEECHKGMSILEKEKDKEYYLYFFSSEGIIPLSNEGQDIELLLDDIEEFLEFHDEKTGIVKDIQEFITNNININDDDYKYELPICDNSGKCFKLCFKGDEDLEDLHFYFNNYTCFYVKKNKEKEYKLYFTTEVYDDEEENICSVENICYVCFKEENLKNLIYYILEKNFKRKTIYDDKLTDLQANNNFDKKHIII